MGQIEQLLNKLIEMWWKPRDMCGMFITIYETTGNISVHSDWYEVDETYSINDLCSLESWLRQFVCWLDKDYLPFCSKCYIKVVSNNDKVKSDEYYEEEVNFRLMLSSIQEDKAKFLTDNIKI